MELIDREAVQRRFENYYRDCEEAGDTVPAQVFADCITELEDAPTIDPIRAAGGCRCGECKKYHAETGWCDEYSYFHDSEGTPCSPAESREWRIFQESEYCQKGEPREAQDDG